MAASKMEARATADAMDRIYTRLKEIRKSTTVTLKPCKFLRPQIMVDGVFLPLKIRYYQSIGIFHLLAMKRFLLGDGTGLGKTLQLLGALAYTWEKEHDNKVIVVTPKSALWQCREVYNGHPSHRGDWWTSGSPPNLQRLPDGTYGS